MPIDLNSLPLRSRSQGSADFVDRIRLAFPDIQSTAAWRNRPRPDSDSAAQFRYWFGPFINNPNSQLGGELRTLIQQASGRGGEPIEDPHAARRFGRDNIEFYPEFARQWGLQTPPANPGQVLQTNERGESNYNPDSESGGGEYIRRLFMFGSAIEDLADDVGFLKDPGNAEDDWKSYVKALSLVGGVLGVGYGLEGLMGMGAGASAGTGTGGTMFSAGSSNPSYFTAATAPASTGSTAGMLTGVGTGGYAPLASPELMSGVTSLGGSGISSSAMSLLSGGSLAPGLDLASLASEATLANPGSTSTLLQKLANNSGLVKAAAQGVGGLVNYFGSQSALNDAMKLAKELQSQSQYNPYNISGPAGTLTTSGNKLNIGLSQGQTDLLRQNTALGNQQFNELSKFNLNDYVDNYVNWSRQIAAPYEKRAEESLNSTLLNTGMLGSEAGTRRYGEFDMNRRAADLQRQIAGETLGANRYNQLSNMWNSSNQNMMNIMNAPLDTAKLGLLAGQIRSGAATNAAQFPWSVGQEQAGGKSGFWNQIGSSLANALPSAYQNMFGNTGSNLANYTNYTVSPYMSGQYQYV